MRNKILKQSLFLTMTTLLVTVFSIGLILFSRLEQRFFNDLKEEAQVIQNVAMQNSIEGLKQLNITDRITLVDVNGTVLFDNEANIKKMDNHNNRPEIKIARKNGYAHSKRESNTLLSKNFYFAKLLPNQQVLRISTTEISFLNYYLNLLIPTVIIFIVVSLFSYFLSKNLAKRITAPINSLNLDEPVNNEVYPELQPLINRLSEQKENIQIHLLEISEKEHQLSLITSHMKEGLILLDQQDKILMANPVASKIFNIKDKDYAASFIKIERSQIFLAALENTHHNLNQEIQFKNSNSTYQVILNPVFQEQQFLGTVMFIFDITKVASQEAMRREFTSNVTHELKTPLTSISGFAEIISAGIVKGEDYKRFAGKIYDEAQRLLALVNDTLKLSGIENNNLLVKERINWETILNHISSSLALTLNKKKQSLTIHLADNIEYDGYASIIQDILYNLIENASKYSEESGKIDVRIQNKANHLIQISIKDNGIGIPEAEQDRIFERFYRVDKSHSSKVSGTGLGLSIVKHGVILHNGKIEIDSKLGKGSSFTIELPIIAKQS